MEHAPLTCALPWSPCPSWLEAEHCGQSSVAALSFDCGVKASTTLITPCPSSRKCCWARCRFCPDASPGKSLWKPRRCQLCWDDLEHLWEWGLCTHCSPVRARVTGSLAHPCMLEADSNHVRENGRVTPKGTWANWIPTPHPPRPTNRPTHSFHFISTVLRLL